MTRFLTLTLAAALAVSTPSFAEDAEIPAAEIVAQADVTVGLNGLVCDFCAIALNKVFRKRDEVAATHVDLETKKLSVIFQDGQTLDDAMIGKLVERAGYTATEIVRAGS